MATEQTGVPEAQQGLLRRAYAAFNARDIDAVLAVLHPAVDWPNPLEGTRLHGHAAVRDYWTRQFTMIDGRVEPRAFSLAPDGRIVVDVLQTVRDLDGAVLSEGIVQHVYRLK